MKETRVSVAGGGLAGVEAAYCLAQSGVPVNLFEMRPVKSTPAHRTSLLGELVCSNSLKGTDPLTAHGLLKKELARLGSIVLKTAQETRVPAGKALAVDRDAFGQALTDIVQSHPLIEIHRKEFTCIEPGIPTIIATGPLTSDKLTSFLADMTGTDRLSFYDAISPIIDAESVDMNHAFFGSRWEIESTDYLNCPLDKDRYYAFVEELIKSDRVNPRSFEDTRFFDACLPVEVIALRGRDSLRFGPMRPVGFTDPLTGSRPYALLQLRRENLKGNAYNLVGFQTRLTYTEQKRIFCMIPALAGAEYLRFGSIHRNTFFDSPKVLNKDLSIKGFPLVFLAGQVTGVEGYMESAAMGIVAALAALAKMSGRVFSPPGPDTATGALISYITDEHTTKFQPMNINFGIMEPLDAPKKLRQQARLEKESLSFETWLKSFDVSS
ncbi:MAG TPA: methylenetetrahydrofolate--tRNA-(uracil(54)-C(5))-methyltransferase (FADH(2)-oxidizing) TrmFO [Deltaproteobacteria bacterium]|nr:methylenetetrahydrofolate--tRNA-(uracil(54)-C(5))-methyltransferase (FADH(2)-oxidizing) TrmFO [Deltaproteobacteria bacterium]